MSISFPGKRDQSFLRCGTQNPVEETIPSIFLSERKKERSTQTPPADRKSNISVAARIGQVVEGGETEMDFEEPKFKITSSMSFASKKYEAMITDPKKENESLTKENAELKAEKSLTNFSYDNISLAEQLFKSLTGIPKTSFESLWIFLLIQENIVKN